jgi:hypothetical protein
MLIFCTIFIASEFLIVVLINSLSLWERARVRAR